MYFAFDPKKKTKKQMDCILNMLNKFEGDVILKGNKTF